MSNGYFINYSGTVELLTCYHNSYGGHFSLFKISLCEKYEYGTKSVEWQACTLSSMFILDVAV